MRAKVWTILIIACLLFGSTAQAQQANLSTVPAVIILPEGVYAPILMPDNLQANESFILSKGGTVAGYEEAFKGNGILLQAYDNKNGRILVISAVSDADGQNYIDVDQHTPEKRAEYRSKFQKGGEMETLGYRFESAEWKNFPSVGRFIMGRYLYRVNGVAHHRGFMRRSVKNGLSITVDMQVYGRSVKAADNTALNKVFDTLSFTGTTATGLTLPVVISETDTVPKEIYEPTFRMRGTTRAGATLTATVMSYATNKAEIYSAMADAQGGYSFDITLPSEGFYMITMEVAALGLETLNKQYTVTYAAGLLPVELQSSFPAELTQDSYKITGTTLAGVTVQMINNGKNTTRTTNNNKTFAFTVNTKEEGVYTLKLSFSKKGFNTRVFDFVGVKGSAEVAPLPTSDITTDNHETTEAVSPAYTDLIAQAETYDGTLLSYHGFVTKTSQEGGEWLTSLALRKTASGYADTVILISDADPGIAVDTEVLIYGVMVGINVQEGGDLAALGYPRIQLNSIEVAAPVAL